MDTAVTVGGVLTVLGVIGGVIILGGLLLLALNLMNPFRSGH